MVRGPKQLLRLAPAAQLHPHPIRFRSPVQARLEALLQAPPGKPPAFALEKSTVVLLERDPIEVSPFEVGVVLVGGLVRESERQKRIPETLPAEPSAVARLPALNHDGVGNGLLTGG